MDLLCKLTSRGEDKALNFLFSGAILVSKGRPKAAVFPVPV